MLKTRLIPVLNILNGLIVRSEDFSVHQNIGNIVNQASRYNEWNVDELIYLDISRTKNYDMRRDDHKIDSYGSIEEIIGIISKTCFMPLTFGGGIRSLEDIIVRITNGADKVVLNYLLFHDPGIVKKAVTRFGGQCIVASLDYKIENERPIVYSEFGLNCQNGDLFEWIKKCEAMGVGEIFINSIDRDGKGNGYDIPTIKKAVEVSSVPIIACGGAGDYFDFLDIAEETNVSAIAAGNFFHFKERAYPKSKALLKREGINVR